MTVLGRATASERQTLRKVLQLEEPKRPKFGNKACYIDSIRFASQAEGRHYVELRLRADRGQITDLKVHPRFELRAAALCQEDGPVKIATYVADFSYTERGQLIVADVKGVLTDVFKLKAKMFKANYGREILVVKR